MKAVHIHVSNFVNESRILKESFSLVESGLFDSVIIIAFWRYGLLEKELIHPKITVFRLKSKYSGKDVALLRKAPSMLFLFFRTIKSLNPDVVSLHQVKLLSIIPILWMMGIKAKLVYDAHELETETLDSKGFLRSNFFKGLERLFIHSFSLVIVVSESIEIWYRKKYTVNRIVTVKNCPKQISVNKQDLLREELNIPTKQMIFLYQGGITSGRGIETILKCFAENAFDNKCVVFLGYGDYEVMVKEYAEKSAQIFYLPAVPPSQLLSYTSSANVGLSLGENVCLSFYYSLPNKLFEYTMADVPIIVSNLVEMKRYVNMYNIGTVLEDDSVEGLSNLVASITWEDLDQYKSNFARAKRENHWGLEEQVMIEAYKAYVFPKVKEYVRA